MKRLVVLMVVVFALSLLYVSSASAWTPVDVHLDPRVRMPGTQPNFGGGFSSAADCSCHFNYSPSVPPVEIGLNWQGSLMSQSARDFLFLASLVVLNASHTINRRGMGSRELNIPPTHSQYHGVPIQ